MHLFWGRSRPLSWLRLQTVVTFKKHNPSWQVKVWYRDTEPVPPAWLTGEQAHPYEGRDYFDHLYGLADVVATPFDLAVPDVIFSDYLRLWLLATEGGWWSDFDILFTAPMPGHSSGPQLAKYHCGVWPVGFMGAPDAVARDFFARVEREARQNIDTATGYQDLGCTLMGRHAKGMRPCVPWVYPVTRLQTARVSYFVSPTYEVPQGYIGFHWYAGAEFASEFENQIAKGTADQNALVMRVTR